MNISGYLGSFREYLQQPYGKQREETGQEEPWPFSAGEPHGQVEKQIIQSS